MAFFQVASAPLSVEVTDTTKTTASLSWTRPDSDGGSPIISYVVEMQRIGIDSWISKVSTGNFTYDISSTYHLNEIIKISYALSY